MEKKYYWLKLPTGFFTERAIKKLRRMAGGSTYTIIYQKLLLLSLENEGTLYYEGVEDTFEQEMSLEFDESIEDIQMTILYLQKNELIKMLDNNTYYMTQISEMIGSETDSARRKRKSRKNLKLLESKSVTKSQLIETKSQDVTSGHTEIEIDKEKEKEIEIDFIKIKEYFNNCDKFSNIRDMTTDRKKLVKNFINKYKDIDIYKYMDDCNKNSFLTGNNNRGWKANFDWIFNKKNALKILEGNYNYKKQENKPVQSTNYEQREYDDKYFDNLYDNVKIIDN